MGTFQSKQSTAGKQVIDTAVNVENILPLAEWQSSQACKLRTGGSDQKMVRFVITSDVHSKQNYLKIPPADVLIVCGDLTMYSSPRELREFSAWLAEAPVKYRVVIAGNHEFIFDKEREKEFKMWLGTRGDFRLIKETEFNNLNFDDIKKELVNCTYLQDSETTLYGYKIYGTPYQSEWSKSAFQRHPNKLAQFWSKIPTETDILITHSPPHGIRDVNSSGNHCGCPDLTKEVVSRVKPILHCFGHIHESYGAKVSQGTIFMNAAFCGRSYLPSNQPIVLDLPSKE